MIDMYRSHRRHAVSAVCLALAMGVSVAALESGVDTGAGAESGELSATSRRQELIRSWARGLCQHLDLQTQQCEVVEQNLVDRSTRFLKNHWSELRPVVHELIEMRNDVDPPSHERVREWATRALPVFENLRIEVDGMSEDVREVLTPMQRAAIELKMLFVPDTMKLAGKLLSDWSRGRGDPGMLWRTIRRKTETAATDDNAEERDPHIAAQPEYAIATGDQHEMVEIDLVERELTVWAKYVANRVKELSFDNAQRLAAQSCLQELSARAGAHRDRYRGEIVRLEASIALQDVDPNVLARIKTELIRLYGPVDDMFAELKRRVDQLATARQLAAAEQRATPHDKTVPTQDAPGEAAPLP